MYDPLGSSQDAFADSLGSPNPSYRPPSPSNSAPWPTTPRVPGSPLPNSPRPAPTTPTTPYNPGEFGGPSPGPYGREPQVYGAPEAGLISPTVNVSSNGTNFEKSTPYLRTRITGLDRNRRDILIKLDAQTNLSNFTGTTYRNVSRSYLEFQALADSLCHSNPQTIVPAIPLPQTSAPTDEEDDRLVRIMLQRWLTRICEDPIILHDEELRSFIESDFGYQPTPRPKRKAGGSTFGSILTRRGIPDEDEGLQKARFELTKLETQFFDSAKAIDKLALSRKALAMAQIEMGNKLINVSSTESHPPLGNALRKLGRTWHSLADLSQAQAISECVIMADTLGYQGMNAKSAKETLQNRQGVLEEYQAAAKVTISKRRNIERLKASSSIRPEKVDEALEDMEEADKYEKILARRAEGISQNLHRALEVHNRLSTEDVNAALVEHARSSIMYERQLLRELEALRKDVNSAADKVVPNVNGAPRPAYIPKLDEYESRRTGPLPQNNASIRAQQAADAPQPQSRFGPGPPPEPYGPLGPNPNGPPLAAPSPSQQSFGPSSARPPLGAGGSPQPAAHQQTQPNVPPPNVPLVSPSPLTSAQAPLTANRAVDPLSVGAIPPPTTRSQSVMHPLPHSSQQQHPHQEAPPGGRFADGQGTQSMFVPRVYSPLHSPASPSPGSTQRAPPTAGGGGDPLTGVYPTTPSTPSRGGYSTQTITRSQTGPLLPGGDGGALDPLGIGVARQSQTMRVTPTRQRLDAREAASKLANMF